MEENKEKTILPTEELIRLEKIIDCNTINTNSIVIFKISGLSKENIDAMNKISDIFAEKLDKKNCSIIFLSQETSLEILSEEQMSKLGWFKNKEKSLIIH